MEKITVYFNKPITELSAADIDESGYQLKSEANKNGYGCVEDIEVCEVPNLDGSPASEFSGKIY